MTTKNTDIPKAESFWNGNKMLPLDEGGALILQNKKAPPVDAKLAEAVLDILDAGLSNGLGEPAQPGNMCVEAAVSAAMGMDTRDGPICVHPELRSLKINMNDSLSYNDETDRAMALRRIAIAQLGTQKLKTEWKTVRDRKIPVSVPAKTQPFKWGRFCTLLDKKLAARMADLAAKTDRTKGLSKVEKALWEAMVKADDGSYYADEAKDAIKRLVGMDDDEDEFSEEATTNNFTDFANAYVDAAVKAKLFKDEDAVRDALIEDAVQVLIQMKSPGTKYLYLTTGKAAKAAKKAKKAAAKKH